VAHPITPTMFTNLGYPDYMFGVSFAAMALAMFLSSPFWGKMGDSLGHSRIFAVTIPLYAISQMSFGLSTTIFMTTLSRLFCGFFSAGTLVASMAYVINVTDQENRGRYMSYYAAINSVCSAFGYFIGGVLGNKSIFMVFVLQTVALIISGSLAYFKLEDPVRNKYTYASRTSSINPFKSFTDMKKIMKATVIIFLITVFLTSFAATSYDNAFNYYIKEALKLPSSYNGIIKAIIGIVSLIVNFTINIYIANKTNTRKSIIIVLALCGISAMVVPFIHDTMLFFLGNIVFFMFNAIYLPIQQVLVTKGQDMETSGIMSGIFNSVRSVGMIFGALFAGFIYSKGNILPFIVASIVFLLSSVISYINYKRY
jgi:DHA1 family multidrug resistance protein-like MFS transporter